MSALQELVESYFKSAGFNLLDTQEGRVVADQPGYGGHRNTHIIWVPPPSTEVDSFGNLERGLLQGFESARTQYPNAKYSVVAHSLEGYTRDFRREAMGRHVELRVPVQFFDAPFKYEDAPEVRSAIATILDEGKQRKRVPQPYSVLDNGEPKGEGDDLFDDLRDELLGRREGPCLRVVVGAAGAGKSVLFEKLFARAYDHFQDRKRQHERFPRPMPLVPIYLRQASALRTHELIRNFIGTDVATPVSEGTFEWMLVNDLSMWMFDGLDELYAGDPDFFEHLLDLMTQPGSKAQLLLCARDSLLTSCEAFAKFLEEYPPGPRDEVRIFRLDDWDHSAKRCFAWIGLEDRHPREREQDTPEIARFLSVIGSSASLKALSGLPYYCGLLLDEHRFSRLMEYDDDVTLIEHVVKGIIEREKGKGLLRDDFFTPGGLREWLGLIAFETYQAGFAGVPQTELIDFAEFFLADGLTEENRNEALTTLLRFPLFAPGTRAGMLTFKHELLAEHLAGGHLLGEITRRPESVARGFGARIDLARSLIGRCVARLLPSQPDGMQAVMNALKTETVIGRAFANLLQILLMASPARDILKSSGINLEGHDLKYVVFEGKDLAGLSFRGCDLTSTEFSKCEMKQACLEAAILSGTRFDRETESTLSGARFGGLERFESVYVGKRRIDDHRQMLEWTQRVTGVSEERLGPCPAALQLRALFWKYVYPNGTGRRDELKRDALRRGKRYAGSPGPEKCIDRCLSFGFLQRPDFRDRIKRAPGETYTQMVEYVRDWRLAPEIAQLLSSLCSKANCKHVPG